MEKLFAQIKHNLGEYIQDGSLIVEELKIKLDEEPLGNYVVGMLEITAGPARLAIRPVARFVAAASGRVDIYRHGRSSEDERIMLLRVNGQANGAPLAWMMSHPAPWEPRSGFDSAQRNRSLVPLTKQTLEQGLDSLLSR